MHYSNEFEFLVNLVFGIFQNFVGKIENFKRKLSKGIISNFVGRFSNLVGHRREFNRKL